MSARDREAALLDLIGELYRAAGDPAHWPLVLARLSTVIDCAGVTLYTVDHRDRSLVLALNHELPEAMTREYDEHYLAIDPRPACALAHLNQPVYDYLHSTEAEIDRSEYYDWHRRRGGFRYYIGAALADADGLATYMGLQRTPRQGHVDEHEVALFGRLLPHLRQAVALGTRFAHLQTRAAALADALHAAGAAMILLDRHGRAAFMTAAAERIVAAADGLLVDRRGRPDAAHPDDGARLRRAIAAVVRSAGAGGPAAGGDLALSRPSGKPPLLVRVAPLHARGLALVGPPIAAALTIRDPAAAPRPAPERLRARYGLTGAEADLALALADGESLREYAERAGITYETARTHLKRILGKTGARRQAELVALVALVAREASGFRG